MRGTLIAIAALLTATNGLAQDQTPDSPMLPSDETRVENAANNFFDALRGEGNYELSDIMRPDGVMMIADRMNPDEPNLIVLPNSAYLASREAGAPFIELMDYDILLARDGIAHIWGPYRVIVDGKTTHCGINSLTFVESLEGFWQLGNSSFTMVAPDECGNLDAPPAPLEPRE